MPPEKRPELLRIENLHAWYGESHILHGMNLTLHEGEVITLLGRNGSGRTTTLKAILGLVGRRTGSIKIHGTEVINMPTHRIAHVGKLGYCPEERGIFASLNVDENLELPPVVAEGGMSVNDIYTMFPNLKERRKSQGSQLSGGEQQMLAIARILRTGANLLLLDEITEGLAPVILKSLDQVIRKLREKGFTIILVEHDMKMVMGISHRITALNQGRMLAEGTPQEVGANPDVIAAYLGAAP